MTLSVAYEDGNGCAGTATELANSQSEAESCVTAQGATVVPNATPSERTFHIASNNGCSDITLLSYSDSSAARCAAAQGYTEDGACP